MRGRFLLTRCGRPFRMRTWPPNERIRMRIDSALAAQETKLRRVGEDTADLRFVLAPAANALDAVRDRDRRHLAGGLSSPTETRPRSASRWPTSSPRTPTGCRRSRSRWRVRSKPDPVSAPGHRGIHEPGIEERQRPPLSGGLCLTEREGLEPPSPFARQFSRCQRAIAPIRILS